MPTEEVRMTPEQKQELNKKLTGLGYPDFQIEPGEDEIVMLRVKDLLICGALYALSLPDDQLKALIDETVQIAGVQ